MIVRLDREQQKNARRQLLTDVVYIISHDALKQCQKNANDGYVYVVDMDLEKFFDNVCQSKLIEVLSRTITDGRVISLIHKYMNAGVISNGLFEKTEIGGKDEEETS